MLALTSTPPCRQHLPRASPQTHKVSLTNPTFPNSKPYKFPLPGLTTSSTLRPRKPHQRLSPIAALIDDEEEELEMSPEEIKQAYEAKYGPSWDRKPKQDTFQPEEEEEGGPGRRRGPGAGPPGPGPGGPPGKGGSRRARDGLYEIVLQVRRVTKVVKGGKNLQFRVVSVVGDKNGRVGVGVGKAKEVLLAVQKSVRDGRKTMVTVKMTKYKTFPHRVDGHYHAADVMLRPASPGTGLLCGGAVKAVLDLAGVENAIGKQMGSNNRLNNARATLHAFSQLRHLHEVAELRGIPLQELWK